MDKLLLEYIKECPVLKRCSFSEDETKELVSYLKKNCISKPIENIIRMVEDVINIDPLLNWKDILEQATKKIVEFLNADAASIRIFDQESGKLVAFGSYQYSNEVRQKAIPIEQSVAGKVIMSGKSYLVPSILLEPDYKNKEIVYEYGFNSLIAIPIKIQSLTQDGKDIIGTIQIYYKENNKEFDPLEVATAEMLARRISYVLLKKQILDLQKLNLHKEKLVEKIFIKLSYKEGIKMKDVFRLMIPELIDILHVQSCSLFSVTPDRSHVQVELEYPVGEDTHEISCMYSIKDHPYFDVLLNEAEPRGDYEYERITNSYVLIKDPLKSRLSNDELKRYAIKNNVNSVLLIPLRAKDVVNYFLIFYAKDRRQEFTEHEIELLTFFGKEIMKALKIEKLDDVLHDFKNPSIAIAGFAKRALKLLENKNLEDIRNKLAEYLDIIAKETIRLQELAIYPHIEGREKVVDLTEVLKNRFRINEEAIKEMKKRNIKLVQEELQPGLFVYCSPFGCERALDNLFDNATKAIPEEGGEISIKSYRDDGMACFEIKNTGVIPEENIDQIRRGEVKGRGLNIIYRFIQSVHGKIDVFTSSDSTTFKVWVPLYNRTNEVALTDNNL